MRTLIHASIAIAALSVLAVAQVAPDAGPDQSVPLASGAQLSGVLSNRSPLDFWTADGNFSTEDSIVMYRDGAALSASPRLHDAANHVFGWPSDLQRINGQIYGIESARRVLYTVDVQTGLCTQIGLPSSTYKNVYSLAYDPAGDRLFAVDLLKKQLLKFNRFTGVITKVGAQTLTTYKFIRALAYRPSDGYLYAVDQGLDRLIKIDTLTGVPTFVRQLPADPISRIEELEFRDDQLYASQGLQNTAQDLLACQLQKIDMAPGGAITNIGPIIPECSPHSLIINSLPEEFQWSVESGPGSVLFADPRSLTTSVTFSDPGDYVLRLTAFASSGPLVDTVTITAN